MAEGYFETEITPGLSKVFVSDFPDFRVLSIYSDLSNSFLAYKIIHRHLAHEDQWLLEPFSKICHTDFSPVVELIPAPFKGSDALPLSTTAGYTVVPASDNTSLHVAYGLSHYNAGRPEVNKLYIFKTGSMYSIFVFSGKECQFANAFLCNSETEVLYYMANALHICGMPQDQAAIYIDYNLASNKQLKDYLKPYFRPLKHMKPDMESPDTEIPFLPELLFPNYLLSLCV